MPSWIGITCCLPDIQIQLDVLYFIWQLDRGPFVTYNMVNRLNQNEFGKTLSPLNMLGRDEVTLRDL